MIRTLRKVWRYLRVYKKLLVISLFLMLINQSLNLISPLIVKEILDEHLLGIISNKLIIWINKVLVISPDVIKSID